MGISVQQYLTDYRLNIAKQQLVEMDVAIADVALATGFTDARYFATLFRRRTGLTPSAFRASKGTRFLVDTPTT